MPHISTIESAASILRRRILDGALGPGARLPEEQTSAELSVSRHTLRAALRQLVAEGLLRHEPHRGVHVPILTPADVRDVFRLRRLIELDAVEGIAITGDVPRAAVEAVDGLVALGRTAGWHEVVEPDLRFHSALVDAAGSLRLARTYAAIQAEIAYCLVQLRPHYDRPEQVAREHRELLDAIVARNAALAVELMRTHLLDAEAHLLGALPESSRDRTLTTWKE
ncbi:MAG TPA: GntR family transcriptional regulator [Gaiellales bacterium]|nr:GntR family transcriptional regulator [Gaiellales bacterium]